MFNALIDDEFFFVPQRMGIERTLGPLQGAIMDFVWSTNDLVNIDMIFKAINSKRQSSGVDDLKYTTIASTVARLVARGLLKRSYEEHGPRGRAGNVYVPLITREQYNRSVVFAVLDSIYQQDNDLFGDWAEGKIEIITKEISDAMQDL